MRLWAELYCPGQGPVVDSCNRDYKHTEFVNKLSNHQLLNEVTALVSIYFFVHYAEEMRMFMLQDLKLSKWCY